MAEARRRAYMSDGGAAIDIYSNRLNNTAVPLPKLPEELPQERPAPKRKVKAKLELSPLSVLGMLGAALLLLMVVFGYVRLYQQKSLAGQLNDRLATLQEETGKLRSNYENSINLSEVEQQAKAMGMRQATSGQSVYVNIPAADKAEVLAPVQGNIFTQTYNALKDGFMGIVEYFS